MAHALLHLYSKRVVSQKIHEFPLKLSPLSDSNVMYLKAGIKMHQQVAALKVVHCILSKLLVMFSKTAIFKKNIS